MLDALQFSSPEPAALARLSDEEWKKALAFSDRAQLTLPLGLTSRRHLPEWVGRRIDQNLANNAERWRRAKVAFEEIASAFDAGGLEFAILKGFSHCPHFIDDPRHRWQSDFDLLFPEDQVLRARDLAASLGYQPVSGFERHPIDHLPVMIRKTGWQWRGDFFDVDMPLAVELHFQLWDERTERFGPDGLDEFWARRQSRQLDGLRFTALHPVDALANSALHLLRHLLRGDLRPSHVYELASFLHRNSEDDCLWKAWLEWHPESLRRLEALSLAIAQRWFDCRVPAAALQQVENLPSKVARWLEMYSSSPLARIFQPNKDELWLHWSLLDSPGDRLHVLRRRMLPGQLPPLIDSSQAQEYLPY